MIYNNSNEPIEIKKINLRIWSLRDQLEAIIEYILNHHQEKNLTAKEIQGHIQWYKQQSVLTFQDVQNDHEAPAAPIRPISETPAAPEQASAAPEGDSGPTPEKAEGPAEGSGDEVKASENSDQSDSTSGPSLKSGEVSDSKTPTEGEVILPRHIEVPEGKVSLGMTLLSDINMTCISFFSKKQFLAGQSVLIEFIVPHKFILSAEIIHCKNYNMSSRILSTTRPQYRLLAKFTFQRPGERTLLRQFVSSIHPQQDASRSGAKEEGDRQEEEQEQAEFET